MPGGTFNSLTNQQKQLLEQAQTATYKVPEDGEELKIHFYLPKGLKEGPKRPVILFFFSSQYDRGNVIQFAPQALYFVERGAVCGLVEYQTAFSHPGSTPIMSVMDGLAAIRFVRLYEDQLHIDGSRVIVAGGGAGANIAGCAALGAKIRDENEEGASEINPLPNAAVLLSSLIDVTKKSFAYRQFAYKPSDAKRVSLSGLVDGSPRCPMIMIHGTDDRMTPLIEAEVFAEKMKKAKKNDFEFQAFEGRDANFFNLNMDPMSFEASLNEIDKFLVKHLMLDLNENPNGASLVSWREEDF